MLSEIPVYEASIDRFLFSTDPDAREICVLIYVLF